MYYSPNYILELSIMFKSISKFNISYLNPIHNARDIAIQYDFKITKYISIQPCINQNYL